jgi:hypothetical protein
MDFGVVSAVRFTHGYLCIIPLGLIGMRNAFTQIESSCYGCFSVLKGLKVNNHR